jgi:hypothetical protein
MEKKLGVVVYACLLGNNGKYKLSNSQSRLAWGKRKTLAPK